MSSTLVPILLLHLFLLLSPICIVTSIRAGTDQVKGVKAVLNQVKAVTVPRNSPEEDYATVKPSVNHKRGVFGRRQVKDCLPKGFKRSSAPSRYANSHTFGSERCTPSRSHSNRP